MVDAPFEKRLKRTQIRDHISEKNFLEREQATLSYEEFQFDYVINNVDEKKTEDEVKKIYVKSIVYR